MGLLALPILAHLTGYRAASRVDFPTLRFLRASVLQVRRRRRMESLLLLALRLLVVALLVFIFARPVISWKASALAGIDPALPTLVLLDASASMSTPQDGLSLFERARAEAEDLIAGLDASTPAGLLRFDQRTTLLGPGMGTDRTLLRASLEEVRIGDGATDLRGALRRAAEVLQDAGIGPANIFVLSDGTATALPSSLAEEWPAEWVVHYHDLLATERTNRWVERVEVKQGIQRGAGVVVDLALASVGGDGSSVEVELSLLGDIDVVREIALDSEGKGALSFSLPLPPEGPSPALLTMASDDMPGDDHFPLVLDGDSSLEVLLVSGDGGNNPREDEVYYLERALEPGAGSASAVRPRVVSAEEVRRIDGGAGDVVFLANVTDPSPLVPDLMRLVEAGGGLFVSVGGNVDPDYYNEVLADLLPARFTEVKTRGRGTFETATVGLSVPPLDIEEFRVFRSGGARGFSRVGFGKVIGTEPRLLGNSSVLLRYSDGLPAFLERRVGSGRVVLFTSSLDDDWTDFPLRSVYVALMHQFARGLSGSLLLEGSPELEVGATVALPVPPDPGRQAWVVSPAGVEVRLEPGAADGSGRVTFSKTQSAGHYELFWSQPDHRDATLVGRFTVRVAPAESSLKPAPSDVLLAAVPGLVFHGQGGSLASDSVGEVVRKASALPALLLLLGLALLAEAALAGRRS
jgi:hypothetical protein